MFYQDEHFVRLLKTSPLKRTDVELRYISYFLQSLKALNHASETALHALSRSVYYGFRESNTVVYQAHDVATCWYILLNGVIYLDGPGGAQAVYPPESFGQECTEDGKRGFPCYATTFTEFIVIDYPNRTICGSISNTYQVRSKLRSQGYSIGGSSAVSSNNGIPGSGVNLRDPQQLHQYQQYQHQQQVQPVVPKPHHYYEQAYPATSANAAAYGAYLNLDSINYSNFKRNHNRLSVSSNGSSFVTSDGESFGSNQKLDEILNVKEQQLRSVDNFDDYSEILFSSMCFDELTILKKPPSERVNKEAQMLSDFLRHFSAFSSMNEQMRLDFCYVMKYAHVEEKARVIMQHGEQLDSWCVIINGEVLNTKPDATKRVFKTGQAFGLSANLGNSKAQFHEGTMITLEKDCQFVAIPQREYFDVLDKYSQYQRIVLEGDRTVLITEAQETDKKEDESHIVKLGTQERLVSHLVEDHSSLETSYIEDFLLTYRTFLKDPTFVSDRLERWFSDQSSISMKDRVFRVVSSWVANHYLDFESFSSLSFFLDKMYDKMVGDNLLKEAGKLARICGRKGNIRKLELEAGTRKECLPFTLMTPLGGSGSFINTFKHKMVGLNHGDKIIAVNNRNVEDLSCKETMDLIFSQEYCCLTVKHNILGMKRVLSRDSYPPQHPSNSISAPGHGPGHPPPAPPQSHIGHHMFSPSLHRSQSDCPSAAAAAAPINLMGRLDLNKSAAAGANSQGDHKPQPQPVPERSKLKKMAKKFSFLPSPAAASLSKMLSSSASNPDVSVSSTGGGKLDEIADFAIKIYSVDQVYKYLSFGELATVRHIINRAVEEFGLECGESFVLYHVQVTPNGVVKQTRLSDQLRDIHEKIRPASRFYIRRMSDFTQLLPPESVVELQKEATVQLLDLKPLEVAVQLTLRDLEALNEVMDPSRNMAKYRNLLSAFNNSTPVIPIFPIFIKDLTVFHLGNESIVDDLINFEKLRLISREIRRFSAFISANPDKDFLKSLTSNSNKLSRRYSSSATGSNEAPEGGNNPSQDAYSKSFQDVTYAPVNHISSQNRNGLVHSKARKSLSLLPQNSRRMYDEIMMTKRVEIYIRTLEVQENEQKLREMSNSCEAPTSDPGVLLPLPEISVEISCPSPPPPLTPAAAAAAASAQSTTSPWVTSHQSNPNDPTCNGSSSSPTARNLNHSPQDQTSLDSGLPQSLGTAASAEGAREATGSRVSRSSSGSDHDRTHAHAKQRSSKSRPKAVIKQKLEIVGQALTSSHSQSHNTASPNPSVSSRSSSAGPGQTPLVGNGATHFFSPVQSRAPAALNHSPITNTNSSTTPSWLDDKSFHL